jgi:hypothetical protein
VRKRQVTIPRGFQQDLDALPVLDLRAVDPAFEHHTLGVHEYVALSAFDLLAAVVAAFFTSHPSGLACAERRASFPTFPPNARL